MPSSSLLTENVLVIDASVAINFNATGRAVDIFAALPYTAVITANAASELTDSAARGRDDSAMLSELCRAGHLRTISLSKEALDVYHDLVVGKTAMTLDDGEAATIAYAQSFSALVAIDDRKAIAICAGRFSTLRVVSSIDLLLHRAVQEVLGTSHAESVFRALRDARMRVPSDRLDLVVDLIGRERAALCMSLPSAFRR